MILSASFNEPSIWTAVFLSLIIFALVVTNIIILCKDSKKQINVMTICVCILVTTMIGLVVFVGIVIDKEHKDRTSIYNSYNKLITSVESGKTKTFTVNPGNGKNDTLTFDENTFDQIEKISRSIEGLDGSGNGFNSIMLAMITLCATLAVVIPYVVGKSLTNKEVLEIVQEEAKKNRNSIDRKIQKTMHALEWSEGHNSRMISYLLLQFNKANDNLKDKGVAELYRYRPEWVIGWASKALVRYFRQTHTRPDTEKFCNECLDYIKKASKGIAEMESIDILIRSIRDAYDLLGFYGISTIDIKIGRDKILDLNEAISAMLKKAVELKCNEDHEHDLKKAETFVLDAVAKRSKYNEYMGKDVPEEEFKTLLSRYYKESTCSYSNKCNKKSCKLKNKRK